MWPRTLFGRTALIIAVALLVAQSTFIWLVHLSFSPLRTLQLASLLENTAAVTSTALSTLSAAEKPAFLRNLQAHGLRVTIRKPPDRGATAPFFGPIVRTLKQRGYPAMATPTRTGVRFGIRLDDRHWLMLVVPGRPPVLPWPRLGFLVMGLLVTGVGALLLVRRVNRPLAALAAAAACFGEGRDPPPLPLDGPTEIAHVCSAFNRMTADARQHERDRALLLAGVSHDLRTPLARLRLAVELLGPDRELREGMIQDIEEMDGILAEFLAYVRHGVEEHVVPGNLNDLVEEVVARYARQGIGIRFIPSALPTFPYRPRATTRLVTNLVDNACRHAGGQDIVVTTGHDTISAEITVADRGPGLTAAEHSRLTDGLIPGETHRRGLGLIIAQRIAETQGGRLILEKRRGGGLLARVRLPLVPPLVEGATGAQPHGLQDLGQGTKSRK
ncbi:MAG: ATP-binding protein [Gammaproteobacteria bacterium]|nr:ATP-binding protein [Gammaproteobacteria bacterium]